jgi:putative long chain acyl-CoA synthase
LHAAANCRKWDFAFGYSLFSMARRGLTKWARRSAQNALELVRLGRLTPAEALPFEVVDRSPMCRLRRYPAVGAVRCGPLVLIPPLMLTAEIYDVAPDVSAVRALTAAGIDAWVIDFGAPEAEKGGMARTLDDHVRAVAWAVDRVRELSGRDVHLGGYSQGGMFAYQTAAYRGGQGIASLVTFGSPVDLHKNLPNVASDVAERFIRAVSPMVELSLDSVEGIPGALNSFGFKLLSPKKEIEQLVDFVRKLHDRQALARRESRRRFLGGEGFVAWPGPALRRFFDDFIVHNRLVSGGMVIDGRTVTLADIRLPILAFVGDRDEFARPATVRAITGAAPEADVHEIELHAGHFGLVVGSTANHVTWPAVIDWIHWRDAGGPTPRALVPMRRERMNDEPEEFFEPDIDVEILGEAAEVARRAWHGAAEVVRDAGETVDQLRWQLPRLRRLERMTGSSRISASLVLAEQAAAIGDRTFFLWRGRAFSYAEANRRVDAVVRGFCSVGVGAGDRVALLMGTRPSYLSAVTALSRLGAIAVVLGPELPDTALAAALAELGATAIVCDPENVTRATQLAPQVLVLGGAAERRFGSAIDMEAIDPAAVALPAWYRADAGRARNLAIVLVQRGPNRAGGYRLARVSHGRWAFSALGVAAAATLRPSDTVYCCLPLHHPTGLLVSAGGALVGGSRLALARGFDAGEFWSEARRYGATVVSYAGEMARALCEAPLARGEKKHPVRLFVGSGMRQDVWQRLGERFGVGVLELYASTERNLVLANASGAKIGSVGRPLPGSNEIALVEIAVEESGAGRKAVLPAKLRPAIDRPGVALVRVGEHVTGPRVRTDVFEPGDRWYASDDVLSRDCDGDYAFVGKLDELIVTGAGLVAPSRVENALYQVPGVKLAAVWGAVDAGREAPVGAVRADALDPERLGEVLRAELAPHERPTVIARVLDFPLTTGFRPVKAALRDLAGAVERFVLDAAAERYTRR